MVGDASGSPVLARAPLLLQESLLFPYSEGLGFEQAVLVKGGKEAAFAGVLANPPSSSFEILHPRGVHGAHSRPGAAAAGYSSADRCGVCAL